MNFKHRISFLQWYWFGGYFMEIHNHWHFTIIISITLSLCPHLLSKRINWSRKHVFILYPASMTTRSINISKEFDDDQSYKHVQEIREFIENNEKSSVKLIEIEFFVYRAVKVYLRFILHKPNCVSISLSSVSKNTKIPIRLLVFENTL